MSLLRQSGGAIQLCQLQGNLQFSTCEVLVRSVLEAPGDLEFLVLDFKHVLALDESACRLLQQLQVQLSAQGRILAFSRLGHLPILRRYFKAKLADRFTDGFRAFDDSDLALEWCEARWLDARRTPPSDLAPMPPEAYELFRGLNPDELRVVAGLLEHRSYREQDVIVQVGTEAREIFFVHRGSVSISLPLPGGAERRLGGFSPGMAFGELAMLDQAPRSAIVRAETAVECHLLKRDDFDALERTHPRLQIALLRNMALGLARLLRKATREVGVFDY